MTRILAEEGVDQALAYVATQRPSILEKVRARANAAREKNRADLLPLLKSAQLQADRNQPTEATRLFTEILAVEPDWTDALDAHLWFFITQGDHAFNHATLDEAFGYFQAAESTVDRLLKAEPDASRSQRDLSVSDNRIGDVQSAQGDLPSALSSYEKGLEIREKLAARDAANADWQRWQRDMSVSSERNLQLQRPQDRLPSALSSFDKGLEIREKLAAARDAVNTDWQRDLSVSYERIGDVQSAQGDLPSALSSYEKGLEIREKLAARDAANTDWQRDLSVSYNKIGDVQSAQGDLPSALSSYKKGLEIREKLAARDAANVQWKTDLVVSLWKLANVLERQGAPQKREAAINYQRALEMLLAIEGKLTAEQKTWISQLGVRLKAMAEPARGPNDK